MTNEVNVALENSPAAQQATPEIYTKADIDRIRQEISEKSFKAGYGKAKEESESAMRTQVPAQQPVVQPMQPPVQQQAQPMDMPNIDHLVEQKLNAHLQALQQQELAKQAVNRLDTQFLANKDKYPDLENVLKGAQFDKFRNVVALAADDAIPNGSDVAWHLAQNPLKMAALDHLATVNAQGAILETRRLAESLRQNEAASQMPQVREPLSQLKPSTGNVSGNAPKTAADYKNMYRGRR